MQDNILLEVKNIHKRFPGVHALNDVSLDVRKGEVHSILGENGAGKSTLIKILGGIYQRDSGEIIINGKSINNYSIADARDAGISVIHQEICLVPYLNVAQNIFLGHEGGSRSFTNDKEIVEKANALFEKLGFNLNPTIQVNKLSIAQQQIVEIVKALSLDAKLIIMDEPTSSISKEDLDVLFDIIRNLKKQDVSIIFISHKIEEILEISDRVTVLRDGKTVATKNISEIDRKQLISLMVGRELEELYNYDLTEIGETILELKDVNTGFLKNINLHVRKGEIVGLAGLMSSGRTEIANVIFGIDPYNGDVIVNNKTVKMKSPRNAINHKIALIPENRKEEGLILVNSVEFNLLILKLKEIIKFCFEDHSKSKNLVSHFIDTLRIKTASTKTIVGSLSGGNQQKVVLGKWLSTDPDVLILDEPTKGIDIGTKFEIYKLIFELAKKGMAIILISSELNEIINLCTRVYVMKDGSIMKELDRSDLSQEKIMHYAFGGD